MRKGIAIIPLVLVVIGATAVATSIIGSGIYIIRYGQQRQRSFARHTSELQALLDRDATTADVAREKGRPRIRSREGQVLQPQEVPYWSQLPSGQRREALDRLERWPTTWVYVHEDALEILFFDENGRLAAFNRCLF